VKLFAAIAFALFPMTAPVAAPAQSPDVTLLTALCQDDYYEDTAGRCADIYASEVLTVEAVLEKYEVVVTEDEFVVFLDDTEDTPVGSILPRNEGSTDEHVVVTDNESKTQPATEQVTVAARVVPTEPLLETAEECVDDVAMTGPAPQRSAPVAAAPVEDEPTTE
jgi:hypothetical protein